MLLRRKQAHIKQIKMERNQKNQVKTKQVFKLLRVQWTIRVYAFAFVSSPINLMCCVADRPLFPWLQPVVANKNQILLSHILLLYLLVDESPSVVSFYMMNAEAFDRFSS